MKPKEELAFFGQQLKMWRYTKMLTLSEAADELGVSVTAYSNWEKGRTKPRLYNLRDICDKLEIKREELFKEEVI